MKDIVDLKVRQVRLYPVDVLPIAALLVEKNLAPFKDTLRFKGASAGEAKSEGVILELLGGEIEHEGKTYLIESVTIERQRLILSVVGTSAVAETSYETVRKALVTADPEGPFSRTEPYLKVEETSCVATLDVSFRQLFTPPLLKFLEKTVRSRLSTKLASLQVVPSKFSVRVSYDLLDSGLREVGVRLTDKTLTIEPRVRTRLEERRYYTLSPTGSETHLALLREFEKALKTPKK